MLMSTTRAAEWTFLRRMRDFAADESGAVTVDWVVLTAAMVGISLGIFSGMRSGVITIGDKVAQGLSTAQVAKLDNLGFSE